MTTSTDVQRCIGIALRPYPNNETQFFAQIDFKTRLPFKNVLCCWLAKWENVAMDETMNL